MLISTDTSEFLLVKLLLGLLNSFLVTMTSLRGLGGDATASWLDFCKLDLLVGVFEGAISFEGLFGDLTAALDLIGSFIDFLGDDIELLVGLLGDLTGDPADLIRFSVRGFLFGVCPESTNFWLIFSCLALARSSIR